MYTVYAERYRDDANTQQHVLSFSSLDEVSAWMREHSNPSSSSLIVPCKHTREIYADPRFIHLGWLPGGTEWLVHEIDGDAGILFSDGDRTCGKAHVSKAVLDMLERFWDECKHPEKRFAEDVDARVFSQRDPGRCPKCGSNNIEGGSADFDRGHVYQRVGCLDCGFSWSDAYEYSNYLPLG